MAELGLQGFPPAPIGVDLLTHYRSVLETVPEEFSTVWHQDHLQKGREPDLLEGWTILMHLATHSPASATATSSSARVSATPRCSPRWPRPSNM